MGRKQKGVKKVLIRAFLAQVLDLNIRQVSRLFNDSNRRIDADRVKAYLVYNGYRRPPIPRCEQVQAVGMGIADS